LNSVIDFHFFKLCPTIV